MNDHFLMASLSAEHRAPTFRDDLRSRGPAGRHAAAWITTVTVAAAVCGLATMAAVLGSTVGVAAPLSLADSIARQELRLEAARASIDARPLIGASHLPPYDARAAVVREESELRRLSSTRSAAR